MPRGPDTQRRPRARPLRYRYARNRQAGRPGDLGHRTPGRTGLSHRLQSAACAHFQGKVMPTRLDNTRVIRAPHGSNISAKSWLTEAPLRMLMNNLDPDVAEKPQELVVYGGIGRAARDWESFD